MSGPSTLPIVATCLSLLVGAAATAVAVSTALGRSATVIALPAAAAPPALEPGTPRGYTASGTATIETAPDVADLIATIDVERGKPRDAARRVRELSDALVVALGAAGVGPADVALSQLQLAAVVETVDPNRGTTRIRGHRAAVTVTITTRDFAAIAGLMAVAAEAGATSVTSQFRIHDLPALKRKVRAMAAVAAREKATDLSAALGVSLGEVRAIVEHPGDGWSWNGTYANQVEHAAPTEAAHGAVQRVTLTVDVTYDLDRQ